MGMAGPCFGVLVQGFCLFGVLGLCMGQIEVTNRVRTSVNAFQDSVDFEVRKNL